jgi:hypothetical protein
MKNITLLVLSVCCLFVFNSCKKGCTDPIANNYELDAVVDNGICLYDTTSLLINIIHVFENQSFSFDSIYQCFNII